jgi:3-oxoacyl-[acyl-carrier protein] reductase
MSGVEFSLRGKVVLVTGASRGIGRAIALTCAGAGADVALTYHQDRPGAERVAAEIRGMGREPAVLHADITKPTDVTALAAGARAAFGRVDVWINNAGFDVLTGPAADLTLIEKLDRLLSVDLRGTVLASWAAVELMRGQEGGGAILNMAWDHVLAGMKGDYAQIFCAAKGGVYSFSRALAHSVAPHIRVNVLGPGWVETQYGAGLDGAVKERITESIPLKRWATPEDVAFAATFLASDGANYITGQMLTVNGGGVI